MKKKILLACLMVTMNIAQGCGDDSSNGNAADDVCAQTCETAEPLKCPGDEPGTCMPQCLELWNGTRCVDEVHASIECAANTPEAEWECDVDDEANVKAGNCESEISALIGCSAKL